MNKTLPDKTELLINKKIMGGCNHPDHILEVVKERGHELKGAGGINF